MIQTYKGQNYFVQSAFKNSAGIVEHPLMKTGAVPMPREFGGYVEAVKMVNQPRRILPLDPRQNINKMVGYFRVV
jgi:hypothetical protein